MTKKKTSLRTRIEKLESRDSKANAKDFVRPLVEEIQVEATAPEVDLLTPEAALKTLAGLEETAKKLERFQARIKQLRPLIEQEEYDEKSKD